MRSAEMQKVLKKGTKQHATILGALDARLELSLREVKKRHSAWNEGERIMTAYMPTKELDAERKARRDGGTPEFSTVFIPYAYAQAMTAHTYWASTFLARSPVYQFSARHGEPSDRVQSVEALMDYQLHVGQHLPPLYCWGMDKFKYGIGIVGHHWEKEVHSVAHYEEKPRTFGGIEIPGTSRRVKVTEEFVGYEGNRIFNVRPHDWHPDPRVSLRDFQKGEFCGRYFAESWTSVMDAVERQEYFNIDVIAAHQKSASSAFFGLSLEDRDAGHTDDVSNLPDPTLEAIGSAIQDRGQLEAEEMVVRISPRLWGLGERATSELWVFRFKPKVAIISAQPLGCYHDRFPYDIIEFDIGGYSQFKRSLLEYTQPLADVMTWLFNTHFYNVRKELNGVIIYDPMRVHEKDLLDNEPGKRIRLRPSAYGTDVRQALAQLPTADVTRTHIQDIQMVRMLAQEILGINENIMGQVQSGGRKTATEVRHASSFGVNRLKNHVEWDSAVGFTPLAQALLMNTQQYYDLNRQFRIVGDLQKSGEPVFKQIDAASIKGFYDFISVDGTMPVDRFAQANLWRELLAQFRGLPPQVMQSFDMVAIVSHIMQLSGAVNVNRFKVQVASPEALAAGAQAGNLVEVGGGAASPAASAPPIGRRPHDGSAPLA